MKFRTRLFVLQDKHILTNRTTSRNNLQMIFVPISFTVSSLADCLQFTCVLICSYSLCQFPAVFSQCSRAIVDDV